MKCVICHEGETVKGVTTVTLERGDATLVFKSVPALICDNCEEVYLEDEVGTQLLEKTQEAARTGVQMEVRSEGLTLGKRTKKSAFLCLIQRPKKIRKNLLHPCKSMYFCTSVRTY